MATVRDRRMPLVDLGTMLGFDREEEQARMLVIVGVPGGSYALAVPSVLDHEELVIKPAAPAVMVTGIYAGQTLPDSGLPMLLLDCAGIAAMAGLQFGREIAIDDAVVEAEAQRVSALLFDDLDGVRRLVPLAIIDRIEPIAVDSIKFSAGRLRLSAENGIIPLVVQGEWTGRQTLSVLRLRDGAAEIGYAIAEALDIVTLPDSIAPAREVGPIAGVVSLEGEQVELLDLYWLFATHGATRSDEKPPVCLIEGADTAWMKTFLKPVLEGAGYRVATKLKADETAAVILTMNSDTTVAKKGGAPVVRLRHDATAADAREASVYRYDRDGLLAALAVSAGGR